MICRTKEIEIPKENPFQDCKLNREPYASILTKVVSQLEEGGVLSICGEWGAGKTTFIRMWEQQLKNNDFQSLYFNMWENDFLSDPLIGIITQFRKLVPNEAVKKELSTISKSFLSIVTGMTPKIVKGVAGYYLGSETAEIIEAGFGKASDSFNSILDKFDEQTNSIKEFKSCLREYVKLVSPDKPIIFIVDELDRCNPHYSVKTLERIKHLFNIPGIIFVLSIDKAQLCNSINGYFGSEQLNSEEYLKRFIDFEYQLPKPDLDVYCNYLYNLYSFEQFFDNVTRKRNFSREDEPSDFLNMTTFLYSNMNLNLRQIEKQFTHLRIALLSFNENNYVNPGVIVLLEYFRQKHYEFYNKMYHKEYTIDELVEKLEEYLPRTIFSPAEQYATKKRSFIWEVSKLICCYSHNEKRGGDNIQLITEGENPDLLFKCKNFNNELLLKAIKSYIVHKDDSIFDISLLIDHLELLTDFSVN